MFELINYIYFGSSSLLLTALVIRRLQFRHISLSWHTGLLYGLPFFPSIFMVFSFAAFMASLLFFPVDNLPQNSLVFANSVITFMISWFMVEKLVTAGQIVLFPFFSHGKIPIQSVTDYYVTTIGFISKVTVIYRRSNEIKRKTVTIPTRYLKLFDHLLDSRLQPQKTKTAGSWFINKEN